MNKTWGSDGSKDYIEWTLTTKLFLDKTLAALVIQKETSIILWFFCAVFMCNMTECLGLSHLSIIHNIHTKITIETPLNKMKYANTNTNMIFIHLFFLHWSKSVSKWIHFKCNAKQSNHLHGDMVFFRQYSYRVLCRPVFFQLSAAAFQYLLSIYANLHKHLRIPQGYAIYIHAWMYEFFNIQHNDCKCNCDARMLGVGIKVDLLKRSGKSKKQKNC